MRWLILMLLWAQAEPMPVGGVSRRTQDITVTSGERLVLPEGTFTRGGRAPDEGASTVVREPAFSLDRHEVTIDAYEAFVASSAWSDPQYWTAEGLAWKRAHPGGLGPKLRASGRSGDHPVVGVSWYEADAYCRSRGQQLPRESQWERACHTEGERFPWGDEENFVANWYGGGKGGQVSGVMTHSALVSDAAILSREGALHLAGNVWEWTADWYGAYSAETERPAGPGAGSWKVVRGGSYMNLASYCTCSHREPVRPEEMRLTIGFRCVGSP